MKLKSMFFLKLNVKLNKPLARLTKKKKIQITRIRNERGSTDLTEIEKIIKEYHKQCM